MLLVKNRTEAFLRCIGMQHKELIKVWICKRGGWVNMSTSSSSTLWCMIDHSIGPSMTVVGPLLYPAGVPCQYPVLVLSLVCFGVTHKVALLFSRSFVCRNGSTRENQVISAYHLQCVEFWSSGLVQHQSLWDQLVPPQHSQVSQHTELPL